MWAKSWREERTMATFGDSIIEIARKELGTKEYPANSNKCKYNTWFYGRTVSGSAYPWCMAFAQWCYAEAGLSLPYKTASCGALLSWYKAVHPECIVTRPVKGCLVIFDFPGGASTDHVGLFVGRSGGSVTTIDGNTGTASEDNGGAVMLKTRKETYVRAYIAPIGLNKEAKEDAMTGEEIYFKLTDYLNKRPVPEWAREELGEAVAAGITDGTNPCTLVPRYQAALLAYRAYRKGRDGTGQD